MISEPPPFEPNGRASRPDAPVSMRSPGPGDGDGEARAARRATSHALERLIAGAAETAASTWSWSSA